MKAILRYAIAAGILAAPLSARAQASQHSEADEHPLPPVSYDLAAGGAPAHRRVAAIEITPLGLFLGHYGGSLEIVPVARHALILSAFYSYTSVADPQFVQPNPQQPIVGPNNNFSGVGGEVGYRYYFGNFGPHGLYLGPSLLLGDYSTNLHVTTFASTHVDFHNIGGALDIGYQAIIGNVLIGIGMGAQYVYVDKTIPDQGDEYAVATTQSAVRPRAALTFGYAL